jgi:hypothetical protein
MRKKYNRSRGRYRFLLRQKNQEIELLKQEIKRLSRGIQRYPRTA